MGIKEQVKKGLLAAGVAVEMVDRTAKTHGWLTRRIKATGATNIMKEEKNGELAQHE